MFNPVATYRIQFHKGFTFTDLEKIIPYLEKLGIGTLYASPIFQATPGSKHGYDTINPLQINPEIGTIEQLKAVSKQLKDKGISWLQDIVPNHMAFDQGNPWLMDLLEKGPLSAYKTYFDQSQADNFFSGPVMVPFLGDELNEIIQSGQLKITWNGERLFLTYADNNWPVRIESYADILSAGSEQPQGLAQLLYQIDDVKKINDEANFSLGFDNLKAMLASALKEQLVSYLQNCLSKINGDKELLKQIADSQYYRLCSWKETDKQINYRRFFTVNGLICTRIQEPEVFLHFHQLIAELLKEGIFQGLRVDHVDGLYDPELYLNQLRKLAGDETYIIVEKILEQGEELPTNWPIQGNTGYDFLAYVNNLFTNQENKALFDQFYKELIGNVKPIEQQIEIKKAYILKNHMSGELVNLTRLFINSGFVNDKELKAISEKNIRKAIGAFLVALPVYRFYGNQLPLSQQERTGLKQIFKNIRTNNKDLSTAIALLEKMLINNEDCDSDYQQKVLVFYQRCMQFTGPLMAKGVEDTLMYTYNRFIGHNEVGDAPGAFGIEAKQYHSLMQSRQQLWLLSLNGTATHDTKRGEDFRARLNVLPDLAEEWLETVKRWQDMNSELKESDAPDTNDEYFIYETLIGAYPMPGEGEDDFKQRLQEYLQKTLREAKLHSNWAEPDEAYEKATIGFAVKLLDQKRPFWNSFKSLHKKVAGFGVVNSLAQVLLKFTSPGVPDVYQGCEHWDLSFVDPDNRRPVDYKLRDQFLANDDKNKWLTGYLWKNKFNGQIKIQLVQLLFGLRKNYALLFAEGDYLPLEVKGKYASNILSYARVYRNSWLIVVSPLNIAQLCDAQLKAPKEIDWADTSVVLPASIPENFEDLLCHTNSKFKKEIPVSELFNTIPLALLKAEQEPSGRNSGILMPVSSLPSSFGIGDFGPEAKHFANFLHRSYQKYWQLLPLSPIDAQSQYSPYSSFSSMAGNVLFISPQLLHADGLLTDNDLISFKLPAKNKVEYKEAGIVKQEIFKAAWTNFFKDKTPGQELQFEAFCKDESAWLDDFALYAVLKQQHTGKPWHQWPKPFCLREKKALLEFSKQNGDAIQKEKWLQYIFFKQWRQLKSYCNHLGIELFGDLPFYVSYDSVDVWANREIFSLDKDGKMLEVAGVPPDYFNADGQLWGMPVFRWDKLKAQGYSWWLQRIRKNMELFDLIRLDHFRAFSSYWSVPGSEKTAIHGTWQKGPGSNFFNALKKESVRLPFIAEDLGDIDDDVYLLRDKFDLPGMRVLQFAFGDQMPYSPHVPHNFVKNAVAYTGTHDNNTTKGWFKLDADKTIRKQIKGYVGKPVDEQNINRTFNKLVMASTAKTTIIPIQDLLDLDETARMNTPAISEGNWSWRLLPNQLRPSIEKQLKKWTFRYNRMN